MSDTYVPSEAACARLGITHRELAGLAVAGKIRYKRTFGGTRFDAEEFIARSGSPPEAPAPSRTGKIAITRLRLVLAVVVGLLPVAAIWKWMPPFVSPPTVQIEVKPTPMPVLPPAEKKKKKPVQQPKKVEPSPPPVRLFW